MDELFLTACEQGQTNVVSKCVRKSLNVNCTDSRGISGLMKACLNGNYDIAKILLEAGANVNQKDIGGQNALFYAIQGNNENLCKLLCLHGAQSSQSSKTCNLKAVDYAFKTASADPAANQSSRRANYLVEAENVRRAEENPTSLIGRDDEFMQVEDRMLRVLLKYDNMKLVDLDDRDDFDRAEEAIRLEINRQLQQQARKKSAKKKTGKKKGTKKRKK